ncbi:MAG TPA: trypsin-like peptidase domain-containing protein [Chthoniobacteraceae bacterium]|jgi:serine protease Do|nr:Peptidase chymotrypsin/Hap [Chthoniobacter sp.]HEV7867839.1 trypsin-like peptidase domain-containing protein [Chthoniobacteraceae bacterium]
MKLTSLFTLVWLLTLGVGAQAQVDPATEPSVIAVSKAMPAVVNINTERVVRRTVRDPYDDFFNNFFGGPMRPPRQIRQKVQSLGSGFIVDPSGFIVTNEHVVARAAELKISVTTNDGKTYDAQYITGTGESDLAFLKIETKEPLPFIDLSDLSPNLLGQTVLVLGNPLGYGSSVARGILSAKARTVSIDEMEFKNLLQTDAAINPGNSGGPVVDLSGKLVGVSSIKMAFTPQGVPTQGLGFAIPGDLVFSKVEEFKKIAAGQKAPKRKPAVQPLARKYFGLQLQDLTPELGESFGYTAGSGVLVADVDPRTAAEAAGMQRGLLIFQVGRAPITSVQEVEDLLAQIGPGSKVDFTVGVVKRLRGQAVLQQQVVPLTAR